MLIFSHFYTPCNSWATNREKLTLALKKAISFQISVYSGKIFLIHVVFSVVKVLDTKAESRPLLKLVENASCHENFQLKLGKLIFVSFMLKNSIY